MAAKNLAIRKSVSDLQKEQRMRSRVNNEQEVEEKYKFGEVLGQGAFGVVIRGSQVATGKDFAVKVINKERGTQMELIEREVEILMSLRHPNIIHLEEVLETEKKIYLILELCTGGELSDYIRKHGPLKEEDVKVIMKKLTAAIEYMHKNDMVHRDLKPENILLVNKDDPLDLKVNDFGLAYKSKKDDDNMIGQRMLDGTCGTLLYMAPEVLENKLVYSNLCDVWSLGVIMYELLCGSVPFFDPSPSDLEKLIKLGKPSFKESQWLHVSQDAQKLINRMLCVDTVTRFTTGEIMNDKWMTGKTSLGHIDIFEMMKQMKTGENEEGERDETIEEENPKLLSQAQNGTDNLDKGKPKTKQKLEKNEKGKPHRPRLGSETFSHSLTHSSLHDHSLSKTPPKAKVPHRAAMSTSNLHSPSAHSSRQRRPTSESMNNSMGSNPKSKLKPSASSHNLK